MFETHSEQLKKVRLVGGDELLHILTKTLGKARQEVEGNDEERLVGLLEVRVLLELLIQQQRSVDDGAATLEHGASIRQECRAHGNRDRGKTLNPVVRIGKGSH
jgi:hypothetical protein